MQDSMK